MIGGFVFDPFSEESIADPYPAYAALRADHPCYRNASRDFWALSRFADVQASARNWELYSSAQGIELDETGQEFGDGVFVELDPPLHDILRHVVRELFTPPATRRLRARVCDHVEERLARLPSAEVVDVAHEYAWPVAVATIAERLGLPRSDHEYLQQLYQRFLTRRIGDAAVPSIARAAGDELRGYFQVMVTRPPQGGGLQLLHDAWQRGAISHEQASGVAFFLFGAGTDAPADLIANSMWLFATHDSQREVVIQHPETLTRALEEVLRFEPPLQHVLRVATRDVEIHGTVIPAGGRVLLLYGAANRDEARFPGADRFDVLREQKRHLAFGEGIHFCLGAPLARLEAEIALGRLLDRHPTLQVAGDVEWTPKANSRGIRSLPAVLTGLSS